MRTLIFHGLQRTSRKIPRTASLAFAMAAASILTMNEARAVVTVDLKSAEAFTILAGAGVSNAGASTIYGDVGSSLTTTMSGFETVTLYGTNHGGDPVTVAAKGDLQAAFDEAAGRDATETYPPISDLGGLSLTTGVYYDSTSFSITGTLILDAEGDPNAVWIFQMGSSLDTGANSLISLINGAQAGNVFWQVGSSASLGADSTFAGTIMAQTSITLGNNTTVMGRTLAIDGAVSLVNTVIPEPGSLMLVGMGVLVLGVVTRRSLARPASVEV